MNSAHAPLARDGDRQASGHRLMPSIFWLVPDRFDTRQDKSSWLEMARSLRGNGWPIKIVATKSRPEASDYDNLVEYVDAPDIPLLYRWIAMINIFRRVMRDSEHDDIIVVNQDCLWLLPFLRMLGRRRIHLDIRTLPMVTMRGLKNKLDLALFWKLPLWLFASRADSYSFITNPLKKVFEAEFGAEFSPAVIWQSGVNTELFKVSEPVRADSADNDQRPFRLLYHGVLVLTRGLDRVIQAIATSKFPFHIEMTIVGEGPDRIALETLSKELGVEDIVHFTGYVPYEKIPQEIARADCCICPLPDLPEWRVSSPLKVLEYLACGKPVILTPIDAHQEVASGVEIVQWTDDCSVGAIAKAIAAAGQRRPPSEEERQSAREVVTANFEWHSHAQKLESLFLEHRI